MRNTCLTALLILGAILASGKKTSVDAIFERPLPNNPDAERSILGAALVENGTLSVSAHIVKPEDFFFEQNRRIFEHMLALDEMRSPIDLVTLSEHLHKGGALEACGGIAYLASLEDLMYKGSNVEHYSKIVKEKALLRGLIYAAYDVQAKAFGATGKEATELINSAAESLVDLSSRCDSSEYEMTYRDAAMRLVDELDEKANPRAISGIATLDEMTGGFRPGELIVVTASQSGAGKSVFAEWIRRATCGIGAHGLYCSGEMKPTHLVGRGLAAAANVQQKRIRNSELLSPDDKEQLRRATMDECPFCTILHGDLSLTKMRLSAKRVARKAGRIDLVVGDYDELISAAGKDELEQQRNLAKGCKVLAIEMDCPVVLVSQLRKPLNPSEVKKPTLERLYGSGAKTKHASIVIFVDRPWVRDLKGDETEATIYVMKNRDGRPGKVKAVFNVHKLKFEEATEQNEEQDEGRERYP